MRSLIVKVGLDCVRAFRKGGDTGTDPGKHTTESAQNASQAGAIHWLAWRMNSFCYDRVRKERGSEGRDEKITISVKHAVVEEVHKFFTN